MASGTGAVVGNASAPTVPVVPTVAPTESGGPREAGTSAPAVAGSGAEQRKTGGMVMGMWVVVWGVLVTMMG